MKAIVHKEYGPPEVAQLTEIPKPVPGDDQVLVKVYSATVNRTDCGFRSAKYFISRFWSGLFRPKNQVLGCEFAGVVEDVGKNVGSFKKGDKVFGYNDTTFGAHAEYLAIDEAAAITTLPANIGFDEAAPISEGAHYAWNIIRASRVQKGQHVLIYGASGAIGTAAVQLLNYFGVRITAVCGTEHIELVKSLGASDVIDYKTQDFTRTPSKFHFVFDAVGKTSFTRCIPIMEENGVYISTEFGKNAENIFFTLITPMLKGPRVLFPIPTSSKEDIIFLKKLVEEGGYSPVIDRKYKLDQITEAYTYVESGQKTGNVVLQIME